MAKARTIGIYVTFTKVVCVSKKGTENKANLPLRKHLQDLS